jgi:hypothetical protein
MPEHTPLGLIIFLAPARRRLRSASVARLFRPGRQPSTTIG